MRLILLAALSLGLTAGAAAAQTTSHNATTRSNMTSTSSSNGMAASTNTHARGNPALKDPTVKTGMALAAGANSFTEGQARERIAKAGFTQVGQLTKTSNGLWTGKAMKADKPKTVSLDFKGAVTAK